jgi:hypothetical protein
MIKCDGLIGNAVTAMPLREPRQSVDGPAFFSIGTVGSMCPLNPVARPAELRDMAQKLRALARQAQYRETMRVLYDAADVLDAIVDGSRSARCGSCLTRRRRRRPSPTRARRRR